MYLHQSSSLIGSRYAVKAPTLTSRCTVKVLTLTEGTTSTVAVLSEYLTLAISRYAVKAPTSAEGVFYQVTNTPVVLSKYQSLLRELRQSLLYCQSTLLRCLQVCCQSINIRWGSLLSKYHHSEVVSSCTVKVPPLAEGVAPIFVILSEYLTWVSPVMLSKHQCLLRELRQSLLYCQSTLLGCLQVCRQSINIHWGSLLSKF